MAAPSQLVKRKKRANTEDTNKINQWLILLSSKLINYCCIAYPSSVFMVASIWLSKQTTPLCGWVEALQFTETSEPEGMWRDKRWVQPQLCCLLPPINCSEQLASHLSYVVHGNSEKSEIHGHFECLLKAKLEMRSPAARQHTRISMQITQLPLLWPYLSSMHSISIPRKELARLDNSCPLNTAACPSVKAQSCWPRRPTKTAGLRNPAGSSLCRVQTAHAALTSPAVLAYTTRGDKKGLE